MALSSPRFVFLLLLIAVARLGCGAPSEQVAALSRKFAIAAGPALPVGTTSLQFLPGMATPIATSASASRTLSAVSIQTPIAIRRRALMQTPSGYIATTPLHGLTSGDYFVVHGDGTVSAVDGDGNTIWRQPSFQFTQWTGRHPPDNSAGDVAPTLPLVHFGLDPVDPFREVGEHPFDVGDLNGDGVDDIAIAISFDGVTAIGPNESGMNRSNVYVFVLDGASGALIWSHIYAGYVNNLAIAGGMLVVAHESGNLKGVAGQQLGEDGSVSVLDGWRFTGGEVTLAWTVSTGVRWAPWLALEKLPNSTLR